jgi:hypothetical protein
MKMWCSSECTLTNSEDLNPFQMPVTQPLQNFPTNHAVRRLTAVLTGTCYSYAQGKLRNIAY